MGKLFEQFIGLELVRRTHTLHPTARIRFWRDPDGPEVDWVIDKNGTYTPVEVKWTKNPSTGDCRHLDVFLSEYPSAKKGYIVCRIPRKIKLNDRVFALPWRSVGELV